MLKIINMYSSEELEREQWKPVVGYEGFYDVSDLGRIRRVSAHKKLNLEDISAIKRLREAGQTYKEIASQFDVTPAAIRAVFVSRGFSFRTPNRIIKSFRNTSGYLSLRLCKSGVPKNALVHILVVTAFVGPVIKPLEINHKDGVTNNPRLTNLEVVTRSENALHGIHVLGGKRVPQLGSKNNWSKLVEADVFEIRRLSAAGIGRLELAGRFGITKDGIRRIVLRHCWKHI